MKAIFAIDPGTHTGVAWGIFDEKSDTVKEAMINRIETDSTTIEGPEMDQAVQLFQLWQAFKVRAVSHHKVAPKDVELVIEDFSLIPGAHAGGKEGISPVRIAHAFNGYRIGRAAKYQRNKHITEAVWQAPGALRNRKHLKTWTAWVVGKEHERAAFCHVGERLRKLIE